MVFDPSKYVFQPRPLQKFDFGAGFRDLAEARFNRQKIDNQDRQARDTLGEQQADRGDVNTRFYATQREAREKAEFDAKRKDYEHAVSLAEQARTGAQDLKHSTVRALGTSLLQGGGEYSATGDPLNPEYFIKAPEAPRFGGGPSGSQGAPSQERQTSQPFQMRSNIGPGSAPNVGKNPFESLPGASAEALPQPPAAPPEAPPEPAPDLAGPPPGAAVDGVVPDIGEAAPPPVEPGLESAPAATAPEQAAPAPDQLTGPNPYSPPAFSPYRIDTARVKAENQERNKPYFEGMQKAVPGRFGDRMRDFSAGASAYGYSPEDTLKLTQPQLEEMTGLWRGELAAEGQAGRLAMQEGALAQREQDRQFANDLKLRDRATRSADKIVAVQSLQKANDKYATGMELEDLLSGATHNPQVANAIIEKLYYANNIGVMTDADYARQDDKFKAFHQKVKDRALAFLNGGLNPDNVKTMKEYLGIAMQGHRRRLMSARDGLYRIWKNAKTQIEKDTIEDKIRGFFSEEFYPAEFNDGIEQGQNMGPGPEPAQAAPPAGDSLGKSPLPRTLDGRPKVSPNGVPLEPGSKVPKKTVKNPAKMTDEQLNNSSEDELMEMLRGAAGAP